MGEITLLRQNIGGSTSHTALRSNRDHLSLLTSSCLCPLALHRWLPAMFVLWQGLLHTCTLSVPLHCTETFFSRLQTVPCLLVACYHESMLLADWLSNGDIPEEWEVVMFPLYCSVVNKKFCIPAKKKKKPNPSTI